MRKGFSITELTIALFIIGIIAAATLPLVINNVNDKANISLLSTNYKTMADSIKEYMVQSRVSSISDSPLTGIEPDFSGIFNSIMSGNTICDEDNKNDCFQKSYKDLEKNKIAFNLAENSSCYTTKSGSIMCMQKYYPNTETLSENNDPPKPITYTKTVTTKTCDLSEYQFNQAKFFMQTGFYLTEIFKDSNESMNKIINGTKFDNICKIDPTFDACNFLSTMFSVGNFNQYIDYGIIKMSKDDATYGLIKKFGSSITTYPEASGNISQMTKDKYNMLAELNNKKIFTTDEEKKVLEKVLAYGSADKVNESGANINEEVDSIIFNDSYSVTNGTKLMNSDLYNGYADIAFQNCENEYNSSGVNLELVKTFDELWNDIVTKVLDDELALSQEQIAFLRVFGDNKDPKYLDEKVINSNFITENGKYFSKAVDRETFIKVHACTFSNINNIFYDESLLEEMSSAGLDKLAGELTKSMKTYNKNHPNSGCPISKEFWDDILTKIYTDNKSVWQSLSDSYIKYGNTSYNFDKTNKDVCNNFYNVLGLEPSYTETTEDIEVTEIPETPPHNKTFVHTSTSEIPSLEIVVDVNGNRGPNILGRDLFTFYIYDDGFVGARTSETQLSCSVDNYYECFARIYKNGWNKDY